MKLIASLVLAAFAIFTPALPLPAPRKPRIFAKKKGGGSPPPPPPPPPPPQFETQASYKGKVGGGGQAGGGMAAPGGVGTVKSDLGLVGDIAAAMSQVGKQKNLGA
jgi:hypothetical protein